MVSTMEEQRLSPGDLPRHRHRTSYVAIVLAGRYAEFGDTGRWRVGPGTVVAHGPFEAHGDVVGPGGARVVNIPWDDSAVLPPLFDVADPDALLRAVRSGERDLSALLRPAATYVPDNRDWPDLLAGALRLGPVNLTDWAIGQGLAPATVSRGFRRAFGTTAARYRIEAQTREALRRLRQGADALAAIAADCGFADQAHLTRAVTGLTGQSPGWWRRVKSVQDREAGGA